MVNVFEMKKARTGDDNERGTRENLHRQRQMSKAEVDYRQCNPYYPGVANSGTG